jgi:hypothetical protein
LRRTHFEPIETRVVIDPSTVDETGLGEDPWRREDFRQRSEAPKSLEASAQDSARPDRGCLVRVETEAERGPNNDLALLFISRAGSLAAMHRWVLEIYRRQNGHDEQKASQG